MESVFLVTSNCGIYNIYSTEEKANVAADKFKDALLSGGNSYAQVEVVKMEIQ